ncbi:MAG TPA: MFS transporter, partial [Noviherbaspirillum sp.]
YWTTFFPAILVLGFGMSVTVAPLTTTVMNALDLAYAGAASGINNAVSRAAALLAIALLGIVMSHAFNDALERRIKELPVSSIVRAEVDAQREKLAAIALPASIPAGERRAVEIAAASAFVDGFRWVMSISAWLALCSSLSAWLMIGRSGGESA